MRGREGIYVRLFPFLEIIRAREIPRAISKENPKGVFRGVVTMGPIVEGKVIVLIVCVRVGSEVVIASTRGPLVISAAAGEDIWGGWRRK